MSAEIHAIEAEMRLARQRLAFARTEVRRAGSRWRDWRSHFEAHPALVGAAVGVIGYLLVPRRAARLPVNLEVPPIRSESSLAARAIGAGLRLGMQHLVPLLAGIALERLQNKADSCPETRGTGTEAEEAYVPRRPR